MDLKKYVEEKCFEVTEAREQCEIAKENFLSSVEKFKNGEITADIVAYDAEKMKEKFEAYDFIRFEVHQFAWTLGDEYKEIWNELV